MASVADAVAPKEALVARVNLVHYSGSVGLQQPLPIAGVSTVGADASSWALGLTVFWRPPVEIGEGWSYAMSATLPYVWMDVSANVSAGPATVVRSSSTDGLGDIVLMPLMLNQNISPDFNINYRVGAYAPTGSYEVGRLANTGKNFWTIELTSVHTWAQERHRRIAVRRRRLQWRKPRHALQVGHAVPYRRHAGAALSMAGRPCRRRRVCVLLRAVDGRQRVRCNAGRLQGQDSGLWTRRVIHQQDRRARPHRRIQMVARGRDREPAQGRHHVAQGAVQIL